MNEPRLDGGREALSGFIECDAISGNACDVHGSALLVFGAAPGRPPEPRVGPVLGDRVAAYSVERYLTVDGGRYTGPFRDEL